MRNALTDVSEWAVDEAAATLRVSGRTATQLLKCLNELADDATKKLKEWPGRANVLTNKLRQIAPNLRQAGVRVVMDTRSPGRKARP